MTDHYAEATRLLRLADTIGVLLCCGPRDTALVNARTAALNAAGVHATLARKEE